MFEGKDFDGVMLVMVRKEMGVSGGACVWRKVEAVKKF